MTRSGRAVLVPAAHSLGGIAAIRSLGRAGYRVHAASDDPAALGLTSRFASAAVVHPPLGTGAFDAWLDAYIAEHDIAMITPGAGFAANGPGVLPRYAALFPTPADARRLAIGDSKYLLFEALAAAGGAAAAHLPPHLRVDLDAPLPPVEALAALGAPLFVKLDASQARAGADAAVIRAGTAEAAHARLAALADDYRVALVQGFVPGRGAGAFLLRWDGRIVARMMHLRLHEMPHTGGASSLRQSWWHQAMMDDALAKLDAIDWRGVAMVEYRWDPATGDFRLMEMNLRFWGSMHLSLHAGVDFPALLADAFFGATPPRTVEGRTGVRCRATIPGEVGYLVSLWRDPAVEVGRKLAAAAEAVTLSLDPRVKSDLLFPGDRWLFARRLARFLRGRG